MVKSDLPTLHLCENISRKNKWSAQEKFISSCKMLTVSRHSDI